MIRRILIPCLLIELSVGAILPEVTSYAKVSRNGQEDKSGQVSQVPESWFSRTLPLGNVTSNRTEEFEGRGIKDILITVSPIYVAPRPKLKPGEVIDHPSTARYSTLDHEMVAKLDAGRKQIQQRFHPPAIFEHNVAYSKQKNGGSGSLPPSKSPPGPPRPPDSLGPLGPLGPPGPLGSFAPQDSLEPSGPPGPPDSDTTGYSKPMFSNVYPDYKPDYKPEYKPDYKPDMKPDFLEDKPISKPIGIEDYRDSDAKDKPPDGYGPHDDDSDFPDFISASSYGGDKPKPIKFTGNLDHPPFDVPYDHDYHSEVIYDHIPDHYHDHHYFHHHHEEHTTEAPEVNDQRLDKRPYSYYFIGKKLWYIPLYFSIYFIIYIAALVLKSIARHKISFPAHLAEAVQSRKSETSWWELTNRVLGGIENFAEKFGKVS